MKKVTSDIKEIKQFLPSEIDFESFNRAVSNRKKDEVIFLSDH